MTFPQNPIFSDNFFENETSHLWQIIPVFLGSFVTVVQKFATK
jgi:hypothetical protein